jgi:hypothetical protein
MLSRRRFLSGLALGTGFVGLPGAARAGLLGRRRCPAPSDCCWPPRVLFDETDNWVGGKNRVKAPWRDSQKYPVSPGEVVRLAWMSVDRGDAGQEEVGSAWLGCTPVLAG